MVAVSSCGKGAPPHGLCHSSCSPSLTLNTFVGEKTLLILEGVTARAGHQEDGNHRDMARGINGLREEVPQHSGRDLNADRDSVSPVGWLRSIC